MGYCSSMQEELDSLQSNHTWDIVPCPSCEIGNIFYLVKLKSNGSLDHYKSRIVALGNRQEYGFYEATFALVVKMTTIRPILAIVDSLS